MIRNPFCDELETRIRETRSALREELSRFLSRGAGAAGRLGRGSEALETLRSRVERRLAAIAGLCPAASDRPRGFDEEARESLRRTLASIEGRHGRPLLPDSLSWISG